MGRGHNYLICSPPLAIHCHVSRNASVPFPWTRRPLHLPPVFGMLQFELTLKCFPSRWRGWRRGEPHGSNLPNSARREAVATCPGKLREAARRYHLHTGLWSELQGLLPRNLPSCSQETPSRWKVSFQGLCYYCLKLNKSFFYSQHTGRKSHLHPD